MATHESSEPTAIAILDDYHSIAPAVFSSISSLKIDSYPQTIDPRSSPEALDTLVERLKPYTIICTMRERTPFPATLIEKLPNLRLLLTTGLRNAALDLEACKARGIAVAGTNSQGRSDGKGRNANDPSPPAGHDLTTQHTWALILALANRIPADDHILRTQPDAWQTGFATFLAGKTLGVVGLGRLGSRVARIGALGFGMKVICWSENLTQEKADKSAGDCGLEKGTFQSVAQKEDIFAQADVLSLHYVLSERSRGIVGEKELGLMKKWAFLVNTSRAGLIDEDALLTCIKRRGIQGVGLDVFWEEPLAESNVWRDLERGVVKEASEVVLSPHMGYVGKETMTTWYEEQAENVEKWLKGEEVIKRIGT